MKRHLFAVVCAVALLAACGEKPPDCADTAVTQRIGTLFAKDVDGFITSNIERAGNWRKDPAEAKELRTLLDEYVKQVRLNLRNVATEGYDAKANKQTCAADFALTTTEGEKSLRSPYVVQALESPKGEYRIDIEAYAALVNAAAVDFDIGYERKARARPATPPADAAAPGNETLTGVLKTAATDSCLSVGEGKDEKCYGFGSQSSLAKTLFASCGDANTCVVTGQFDHGKEQLLSVQQAARGK